MTRIALWLVCRSLAAERTPIPVEVCVGQLAQRIIGGPGLKVLAGLAARSAKEGTGGQANTAKAARPDRRKTGPMAAWLRS